MSGDDKHLVGNDDHPTVELTEFGAGADDDNINNDTKSQENVALLVEEEIEKLDRSTFENDSNRPPSSSPELQRARRLLYLSHLFSQGSEQSWQFCLTVFLAALTNYQSLLLVSTYGLTTGLGVALLGSTTGSWIDRTNRLVAARGFIFTENVCVVVATIFCFMLLSPQQHHYSSETIQQNANPTKMTASGIPIDFNSIFLIVGIHILGAAARVLDESFLVAMERDWVVVMSRYSPEHHSGNKTSNSKGETKTTPIETSGSKVWLSETNVAMKQIDLSCKVVAPAISGFLIAWVDNRDQHADQINASSSDVDGQAQQQNAGSQFRYAALVLGIINVLALVVEYFCTTIIYKSIPDLAILKASSEEEDQEDSENFQNEEEQTEDEQQKPRNMTPYMAGCTTTSVVAGVLPQGLQIYLKQQTAPAGIGLALLYLNALTFDAIMTAYLVWRNMGLENIGIWRGVSSAVGLLGTCVYHWSAKTMSLESTGQWSVMYEFACLSLSYASLFVDDNNSSLAMLIAGVCASRIGLWVFDITVTQMMQEYIPDGIRGVVGGVQQSLNASFHLLSFALGIVFPDPKDFHIYVAAGYASVGIAMFLYSFGTFYPAKRASLHNSY